MVIHGTSSRLTHPATKDGVVLRTRKWMLSGLVLTLTALIISGAVFLGLEVASWLAGIGSLVVGIAALVATMSPPQRRATASSSARPVDTATARRAIGDARPDKSVPEDFLVMLRADYRWLLDRRSPRPLEILLWTAHLRSPTIIHAVQAAVAAKLSSNGVRVLFIIEDLHESSPAALTRQLTASIQAWFRKLAPDAPLPEYHSVSGLLLGDTDVDGPSPFQLALDYFRHASTADVLRESKTVAVRTSESAPAFEWPRDLAAAPAYRLLFPAALWSTMRYALGGVDLSAVMTLGGADERPMWERWHHVLEGRVSHLYLPWLPGVTHADSVLRWTDADELRRHLITFVEPGCKTNWESNEYVRWIVEQALLLPMSAADDPGAFGDHLPFRRWSDVRSALEQDPYACLALVAEATSSYFLAPLQPQTDQS
jgi:hypothetical protein